MSRLFAEYPQAITRAVEIAQRASAFSLDELRYEYPHEVCPPGRTPMEHLIDLTWRGAVERFPFSMPDHVRQQILNEFALIEELNFAPYFLTVHDLVTYARSKGILCQGRGAAANSAVCYCLGVTAVDPARIDLLFERFVSRERNEPPDIDIDFEHERREEVIQYIYNKYGRHRAALTAEVISYRGRSAVRDVGKALGLSLDCVDRLAKNLDGWGAKPSLERLRECGVNPHDPTIQQLLWLTNEVLGFPRHLSQHVGGFVITRGRVDEIVPIENAAMPDRTVIEWDKDDIDAMGMLTCISKAFAMINRGVKVSRCQGVEGDDVVWSSDIHRDARILEEIDDVRNPLLQRLDCVAEEQGTVQEDLSSDGAHATKRDVWPDIADAASGRINPVKHRRGLQPQDTTGVCSRTSDCQWLTGGTGNAMGDHDRDEHASTGQRRLAVVGGDRSDAVCPDRQSGATPEWLNALDTSTPRHLDTFLLELHTIPPEDPAVYDMICHADTIGVFQIESRAQMSMLPRLRPRCFYDLVIEVAIVRPGPIQGNMVHPYLRRRNGEEKIEYPNEAVKRVLGKTLGVPLFQEQAMSLAIVAAGFTPGEADALRRAMAAWKRKGDMIPRFGTRLIDGMLARGYPREFAERCFEQIKGFSEYGFPESHAASFALLVYASAWLKCHHPAAFAAALINSQPMGFYAPAQIVRDAREHGVEVRAVDVCFSQWDCTLETHSPGLARGERGTGADGKVAALPPASRGLCEPALRLGMRLVKGLREEHAQSIAQTIKDRGQFKSLAALHRASGVPIVALRRLAAADAFGSMGLDRQKALWHVRALRDERLPMFEEVDDAQGMTKEDPDRLQTAIGARSGSSFVRPGVEHTRVALPPLSPPRKVIDDYATTGLSLKAHPVSFMRERLTARKVTRSIELKNAQRWPQGKTIAVGGIVLVRQRPGTASGIVFITIEDETGIANLIVRPHIYERYRRVAKHGVIVIARGQVERQGEVIHINVSRIEDASDEMRELLTTSRDFH